MQDFLLILANVFLVVCGQTLIKQGMNKIGSFSSMPIFNFLIKAFTAPLVIIGLILYVISAVVWVMVLSRVDLSVAYPMLSLGYILILFSSWFFLGETITVLRIVGVFLICLGVFFVFRG